MSAVTTLAANEPAGGAAVKDLILLFGIWGTLGLLMGTLAWRYRRGGASWFRRLAGGASRLTGLPPWAAMPIAIMFVVEAIGPFALYWDVLKHVDRGRDEGAFGNPAHIPLLASVALLVVAGLTSIIIGGGERGAVRLTKNWKVPLGGVLMLITGVFSVTAFPIDDIWHRFFGQDVTAWGPAHLLGMLATDLSIIGLWMLFADGRSVARREGRGDRKRLRVLEVCIAGFALVHLTEPLIEFDIGVPQYRLLFQPILVALIAGLALTIARIRCGRGGALGAVAVFMVIRGYLTISLGSLGYTELHFPLYVGMAVIVEVVALRVSTRRPLTLGATAGALMGTVGLATEWVWSHVWSVHPWTAPLLPEAAILAAIAGTAGGVFGGLIGRALSDDGARAQRVPGWLAPAATVAVLACLAYPLPTTGGAGIRGDVTLHPQQGPDGREARFTARITPPDAVKDTEYFYGIAFQGGNGLRMTELERVGPGVYRSVDPIPIGGEWKAAIRIGRGNLMTALPIHAPRDDAIPAKEIPALPTFTREFVAEKTLLRREEKNAPAGLWAAGYVVVGLIGMFWLGALTLGVRRYDRHGGPVEVARPVPTPTPVVAPEPA